MTALPSGSDEAGREPGQAAAAGEGVAGGFESLLDAVEQAAVGILDEAEAEARRRVEDAERLAAEKAAEVARRTDAMIAHANDVNQRAQALLEALDLASRELGELGALGPDALRSGGAGVLPPTATESADDGLADQVEPQPPKSDAAEPTRASEREPLRALRERLNQIGRPPRTVTRAVEDQPAQSAPAEADLAMPSGSRTDASVAAYVSEGAVLLATQMAVAGGSREQIEARLRNDFGINDPGEILDGLIY